MKASESRKTDIIIATVAGVFGLGLAGVACFMASNFGKNFKSVGAAGADNGQGVLEQTASDIETTKKVLATLATTKPAVWREAEAVGRRRGFLVSTGLVFLRGADETADRVIDLDKEEPRLREGFPNSYWQKYPELAFCSPNVGDLDPDKDFFTTRQEYEFSQVAGQEFSPVDGKSFPPRYFLLRYEQLDTAPYTLKFSAANPPEFTLRHENENRDLRWSDSAALNEDVNGNGQLDEGEDKNYNGTLDAAKAAGKKGDEGRFLVLGYKEVEHEVDGFKEKKIEITVEDTTRPALDPLRKFQLLEGASIDLPVKLATFSYLPKPGEPISKKEFEKFTLPDTIAPFYVPVSVDADKAVLEYEDGGVKKQVLFKRGQAPEMPKS